MEEDKLIILRQEVSRLTDEIKNHLEESQRLETIRDVLQKEIELYEVKPTINNELPF